MRGQALYVLIGLQGSGKSTWARAQAERMGAALVASDEIRNELEAAGIPATSKSDQVFRTLEQRVAGLLDEGRSVIADATHVRRAWRQNLLKLARARDVRCVAVWFDLPLDFCLKRNAQKPGGPLWGERVVPKPVLLGMWRSFEPPTLTEFDEIWRLTAEDVGALPLAQAR